MSPADRVEPQPDQAVLDNRLRVVGEDLSAAAGNASLCALSKVAGSVPAAKYLEGRHAVLRDLRRRATAGGDVRSAAATLAEEWQVALGTVTDRHFGPDWLAYRAGGVDELRELLAGGLGEPGHNA